VIASSVISVVSILQTAFFRPLPYVPPPKDLPPGFVTSVSKLTGILASPAFKFAWVLPLSRFQVFDPPKPISPNSSNSPDPFAKSLPFREFVARDPANSGRSNWGTSSVVLAHIEPPNDTGPPDPHSHLVDRHAETATDILAETAESAAQKKMQTYLLDIHPTHSSTELSAAFQKIDVMSESGYAPINVEFAYDLMAIHFDPAQDKALIAIAAGNNGSCAAAASSLNRVISYANFNNASISELSPYAIKVTRVSASGQLVSYGYGNFPDLAEFGPPDKGPNAFAFYYYPMPQEYYWNNMLHYKLVSPIEDDPVIFQLRKSIKEQIDARDAEYKRGLKESNIDPSKPRTDFPGLSFSTPRLGGELGAGIDPYPDLSPMEKWVAAITAGNPVLRLGCDDGTSAPLHFRQNPRGIAYEDNNGGFGQFMPDRFAANLAAIQRIKVAAGAVTKPVAKEIAGTVDHTQKGAPILHFEVPDDFTVTRVNIVMKTGVDKARLNASDQNYPALVYELADPAGNKASGIAGLQYDGTDATYPRERMFTTAFFTGDTAKGQWTFGVRAPYQWDVDVEQAKIIVYGFEKGDPLDAYLDQKFPASKKTMTSSFGAPRPP